MLQAMTEDEKAGLAALTGCAAKTIEAWERDKQSVRRSTRYCLAAGCRELRYYHLLADAPPRPRDGFANATE